MDLPLQKMILTDIGKFSAQIFPKCRSEINMTKKCLKEISLEKNIDFTKNPFPFPPKNAFFRQIAQTIQGLTVSIFF